MPFQIRPVKEFIVRPALPAALSRLPELGLNLMWRWNHSVRAVFRRLDPAAWKNSHRNPVVMLGQLEQAILERAAADPRFLALYRNACQVLDTYLAARVPSDMLVAYFSMEYGLLDCLPIYSGGLGVLSGDHLKASSDALLPLVGVGLLYQNGYLRQKLDPEGWQQEHTPVNDFYSLPITPETGTDGGELIVSVVLTDVEVFLKVWRIDVGRVRLYLLDSNIPRNAAAEHREITNQLYGGDNHKRIHQEIVLGIGGLRALKTLGLHPTVYHMNEGHSAFLAIERIRVLMAEQNLNFEEALAASRINNVFTTHTSVPAGLDRFDGGMIREHFAAYCQNAGIPFETFLALGRAAEAGPNEPFSMAICAMQTSAFRNAVSRLHRRVSQEMWAGLWPNLPVWEVPIASVTNGVHLTSWINGDLANLYDQYLQADWREGAISAESWDHINEIPAADLWEAHRKRKRRLVAFVRERAVASALARNAPASEVERAGELLDPEALTIGFARRFATYKRATLVFRDLARLKRLLANAKMPVQLVVSGKAHPKDLPGKALIREIVQFSKDPDLAGRVVFVEDYGIEVASELVQAVDLWLNTPRRGEEACGTSGIKAGINGVLNLSVLDGWFDEAAEDSGGWAIGNREPHSPDGDEVHAAAIYSILENEIVPLYYETREEGVPRRWVCRLRQSLRYVSANYNCQRMVEDYRSQLYDPAHRAYEAMARDNFSAARQYASWNQRLRQRWPEVRILDAGIGRASTVTTGTSMPLEARIDLAGLTPGDVLAEALVGRIGPRGDLEETQVLALAPKGQEGTVIAFGCDFAPHTSGRLGFAVRLSPNHYSDPLNRPCNAPIKWHHPES
ncbi:MAG: alpha-glucan family phosphorylase [Bryobacterales bacterium]|nr:alpha-glucan family phosphorylase [Bryobacterales bacterium]